VTVVVCPHSPRPELNFESKKRRRAFGMEQHFGCNFAGSPCFEAFFLLFSKKHPCGARGGNAGKTNGMLQGYWKIKAGYLDMCCGSIAERAIGRTFLASSE